MKNKEQEKEEEENISNVIRIEIALYDVCVLSDLQLSLGI